MFYSEEYSGEECYGRIEKDILVASAKVEGSPQLFGSDYGRRGRKGLTLQIWFWEIVWPSKQPAGSFPCATLLTLES
ncbi:hypothetical protein QQP08_015991 [Theobroma cacao]|nr:hypothetical protein QQP08_015991 [Theobroma cacao]